MSDVEDLDKAFTEEEVQGIESCLKEWDSRVWTSQERRDRRWLATIASLRAKNERLERQVNASVTRETYAALMVEQQALRGALEAAKAFSTTYNDFQDVLVDQTSEGQRLLSDSEAAWIAWDRVESAQSAFEALADACTRERGCKV